MRLLRIFLAIQIALLAPALQAKDQEEKRVIPYTRLAPGQGMVMMRVITNRKLSAASPKWDKLEIHELKTGKKYKLDDLYDYGHHATFVMSLPPGDYQADRLRVGDPSWQSLAEFGQATFLPEGAWRFSIEAGRMTNLGSVLFVQPYSHLKAQEPFEPRAAYSVPLTARWILVPDENLPQRNAYLFHPDDYPSVLSKARGWSSVPADAAQSQLTPHIKMLSLALSGATPTVAGGMLFGEHFGQVAWRHPDGKWSWEDTGTVESILAAADSPNGTRYAVAEGSLLLQRIGPGDWRRIPVDLEDATPCLLYADRDNSLLTVWEQFQKFTALRYRPGAEPTWTKEWEMPAPKFRSSRMIGFCHSAASTRGLIVTSEIVWFFSTHTSKVVALDFTGQKWTHSDVKFSGPVGMLPDGMLYSMDGGASNQIFKVSKDLGATWEERARGTSGLTNIVFRTPDEGFATINLAVGPMTMYHTTDGGRSWHPLIEVSKETDRLLALPGEELLMATKVGQLYSSSNNGKSWRLERDSTAARW